MAFTPENPDNPQDLMATFGLENTLTGFIYTSDEGSFSRINGEWVPLNATTMPVGSGAMLVFVKPEFVQEYDARMLYREYPTYDEINDKFGITPAFQPATGNPEAPMTAAGESEDGCPPATQDILLNLENRQHAITFAGYGPLNPARPNEEFWNKKADRWSTDVAEAKSSRCGNCAVFIRTPKMLDCIETGLGNEQGNDAWGAIDAGELGYCEAFDFKCASSRTCDAWVAGGPVTEEKK
jgi:hypothetical protein